MIILGLLLVVMLVPWDKVNFLHQQSDWSNDDQATIDSLEKEIESAKMQYMENQAFMSELNDSLSTLSIIIERNNANYRKLKIQNERLQHERDDLINRFSDDDIERYLSNRYGK